MTTIRTRTHAGAAQRLFLLGLFFALAACSEERVEAPYPAGRTQYSTNTTVSLAARDAASYKLAAAAAPTVQRTRGSLAYAHTVTVELGKEQLAGRVAEIQNACASSKDFACELLDVATEGVRGVPSGSVRMRLAPAGVEPMIAIAAKGGEVTGRTTHAEDLAQPVADTERRLALMTAHRDRLAEFMKSKDLKVDQLITVSKELATVQSQIDEQGTERASLQRRIATELLVINLVVPSEVASREQRPVRDAVRQFGSSLLEALGDVIRAVAVILPWMLLVVPLLVVVRLFWRSVGRWMARREARRAT